MLPRVRAVASSVGVCVGRPSWVARRGFASSFDSASDKAADAAAADWKTRLASSDAARKARAEERAQNLRAEFRTLSGRNHSELYKYAGKPFTTPRHLLHPGNALAVPATSQFTCTTLSEEVVRVPEVCSMHRATLLVVGFNQQAFSFGQQWLEDFTQAYPQDGSQSDVRVLQLSIISNSLIGVLFGSYMTRRFKATVDESRHSHIAMVSENIFDQSKVKSTYARLPPPTKLELKSMADADAAYQAAKKANPNIGPQAPYPERPRRSAIVAEPGFSVQNPMLAHLLLIDSAGRIRWRAVGPPQDDDLQVLRNLTAELARE